jgi:hypothetical protein
VRKEKVCGGEAFGVARLGSGGMILYTLLVSFRIETKRRMICDGDMTKDPYARRHIQLCNNLITIERLFERH